MENCAKGFDYRRSQYRIEANEMRLTYLRSFVPPLQLAIQISLITAYSYPENGRKLLFRMHTHSRNVSRYPIILLLNAIVQKEITLLLEHYI